MSKIDDRSKTIKKLSNAQKTAQSSFKIQELKKASNIFTDVKNSSVDQKDFKERIKSLILNKDEIVIGDERQVFKIFTDLET